MELLAGETVFASDLNSVSPEEGRFETIEVSFVAQSDNANLGENLQIRLSNPITYAGAEVNFDNVGLEAIPVSTVDTLGIAALMILGMIFMGWRSLD